MKTTFFIFLVIISPAVFAQKVVQTVVIKDADSQLPIEDVTVLVAKTKQILISNKDGKVSFVVNGNSSIQFSHPSYISLSSRLSTFKSNNATIYLKSSLNTLDELIVTRQHPQKILKALVQNSVKNFNVPARLKVYCREFFKLNGVYSYYNDGLINFQISGNQSKTKATILVEQNRSFGVVDDDVSADLLGYNLNDITENYYTFKYLTPVLDAKAKDNYYFLIRSYSGNEDYYVLTATPLDESSGLLDEYRIVYDNKKNLIIESSSKISPISLSKNNGRKKIGDKSIYQSDFKTTYIVEGVNYFLVSSKEEIGFEKSYKKELKNIEVRNYMVTTNFSNNHYTYREPQVFKEKTLLNKGSRVHTNYWDFSGLVATNEEQKIIAFIEKK